MTQEKLEGPTYLLEARSFLVDPSQDELIELTAKMLSNVSGVLAVTSGTNGTSGAMSQVQDPNPPAGYANYYVATTNSPEGASVSALGCANPGVCLGGPTPGAACSTDAQCGSGGTCLNMALSSPLMPISGCPRSGDRRMVVQQVIPGNICP